MNARDWAMPGEIDALERPDFPSNRGALLTL
jgi:hypothetical protein